MNNTIPVKKDNFKAVLVSIGALAAVIGITIGNYANETSYTVKDTSNPNMIHQLNELGNGMTVKILHDLSDDSKLSLANKILSGSSDSVKALFDKTSYIMKNFPDSKNPLESNSYVGNVFSAVTDTIDPNDIKSVNDDTSDKDIAKVKFILALIAETTESTLDNIQVSEDNKANSSAISIMFNEMLVPDRSHIRSAIKDVINEEIKNPESILAQITMENLEEQFNDENNGSTERLVLDAKPAHK
jgi:hypothetical protein